MLTCWNENETCISILELIWQSDVCLRSSMTIQFPSSLTIIVAIVTFTPSLLLPISFFYLLPIPLLPLLPISPLGEDSLWYGDIYVVVVGIHARSLHHPEDQEFTLCALRSVRGSQRARAKILP